MILYEARLCVVPVESDAETRFQAQFWADDLEDAVSAAERWKDAHLRRLGDEWRAECLTLRQIEVWPIDDDGRCPTSNARVLHVDAK